MKVLAGVKTQYPDLSLAPNVHGLPERPTIEASYSEVGPKAEYAAEACKLEKITKWCPVEENNS